jgi:hypothetical protein
VDSDPQEEVWVPGLAMGDGIGGKLLQVAGLRVGGQDVLALSASCHHVNEGSITLVSSDDSRGTPSLRTLRKLALQFLGAR